MIDTCQRNKSDRRMLANAQQMLEDSRKKIDLIQMQLLRAKREAQVGCPRVNFDQVSSPKLGRFITTYPYLCLF